MSATVNRIQLTSIFPIVRTSAGVRNGDDINVGLAFAVDDPVRESLQMELPARKSSLAQDSYFGIGLNEFDSMSNGIEQFGTQAGGVVVRTTRQLRSIRQKLAQIA